MLRKLFIDPKTLRESFGYCKHYVIENVTIKNADLEDISVSRAHRLSYRKGKLYLKDKYVKEYLPDTEYKTGDWLCLVGLPDKNEHGLPLNEINHITSLLSKPIPTFKRLRSTLLSQGIKLSFSPCNLCQSMLDLRLTEDDKVICKVCEDLAHELTQGSQKGIY